MQTNRIQMSRHRPKHLNSCADPDPSLATVRTSAKSQIFATLASACADVDEAIAAISAPPVVTPTRMGTAGGFLRFGGAGGERRWTFFVALDVDLALTALSAGLGGVRPSKERTDEGDSCCGWAGGTASAPPGDIGETGS